ncbi:MAG: 3-oxoacyl-[acyl-carrier-protein] reductase [Phycisphaerales bacterium]
MSDQRVAVVTGASRGIGRAIAVRLAKEGRHVVLSARSEAPLNDLKAEIEANGGAASVKPVDISDRAALAAMIESVGAELGRLDILVNNAGITRDNLLLRMSDEEWDDVISTNLTSVFVACRAAARTMMRGKFGRICTIASTSGLVGNAGQSNYAAAKSGVIGLMRSVARELGGKNITANVVAPGFVQTDMTKDLPETVTETVKKAMSVRELGVPEDIAAAVSYVTADDAGYLTGQVIAVDGGLTMC